MQRSSSSSTPRGRCSPRRGRRRRHGSSRARAAALAIRTQFPQVPAGIASVTDRTLPHLFPTIDVLPFRSTLARSIGIERPPPSGHATVATDLGGLAAIGKERFFSPEARRRLLVVFTDGETKAVAPGLAAALREARIRTAFVHVRRPGESIFVTSAAEHQYRSDPSSGRTLAGLAEDVGGAVFAEGERRRSGAIRSGAARRARQGHAGSATCWP